MTLSELVSDFLRKSGFTESDGPPVAYFYAPSGGRHTYVTIARDGFATQDHAERSFVSELSRIIPAGCAKEDHIKECTHLFWRERPLVELDGFGTWGFQARFLMVDPFHFSFSVPALEQQAQSPGVAQ